MRQKIYILGLITTLVIFTGTIFKVNHFPGAGILLTAGLITLVLVFLPAALINSYRSQENRNNLSLYIVSWITCLVIFTAMLFKVQHWPYAGVLLTVALPFPYVVFLPVFLIVTSKIRNFNIYNTVYVLLLLALNSVFSALLALNVAKVRIEDSYSISGNYCRIEKIVSQLPAEERHQGINRKIDEVLDIVKDYRTILLDQEGISPDQWLHNPGNLMRPDSRIAAAHALAGSDNGLAGSRLESSLKSLVSEMGNTKGLEELAKAAPVIFNLEDPFDSETSWADRNFRNNNLSWVLICLDGLEVNLKIIQSAAYQK